MQETTTPTIRRWTLSAITIAAVATLAACGDKNTPSAPSTPAGEAPAASAPAPAPTEPAPAPSAPTAPTADASAKLNVYIDCFNATQERGHKAWKRYASWVKDIDAGPTGSEKVVYGTYTVSDHALAKCAQPVMDMANAQPSLPELDAAAKEYSTTLAAWGKALVDADKYYSREDYKDDAMAQGKAMHADFVKHYKAYNEATKKLATGLDAENDKRQLAQLAELEKAEGRKFNYWHMSTMLSAKQLVTLIEADTFDADAASAKLKAYEDASSGLLAFAKEPNAQVPMTFSTMESAFEELLVAAKQRIRRVRDNTPYTTGEQTMLKTNAWMVEGTSDRVIRDYNKLVEASNRLN